MKKCYVFVLLFLANGIANGNNTLPILSLADWKIIVDPQAIESEKYAAEELKSLLRQSHQIDLPIVTAATPSDQAIYIGPGTALSSNPVAVEVGDLGEEGLRIRVTEKTIAITGGRPRGTLYGVYEFAERYLGIRFLTHDHTYFPNPPAQEIPCEDFTYKPTFSFRWPYYQENAAKPDFAARLRVNTVTDQGKLGGKTQQSLISHSLMTYLPPAKYGKDHPEYFALVDGVRKLEMGGGGPEVCVSNPAVIETVAMNVIADLTSNPGQRNISVSQNDNDAYCRCSQCEVINQAEGTPMGSHLAFVNGVAERVEQKFPDVKVGTLAYWYTRKPPLTIKPRKNVQIQLCSIECCTLHPLNDPNCSKNKQFFEEMMKWKENCQDIWIWNYNTNFHYYDLPFPNLRSIGPNVRFFAENNVKGVFMQANGNGLAGEMSDLRNYVIARCLWNPSLEGWTQVEEFCRLHYGKAAGAVLEYLTFLHDNAEKRGLHPACFPSPEEVGLDANVSMKAYEFMQRALAAAEEENVRARVEKASIYVHKALLETAGRLEFQGGQYRYVPPSQLVEIPNRYMDLVKKYGMTMVSENRVVEAYQRDLMRAIEGIPAVEIENSVWRLRVIPKENGRMVEMLHKPSGRNLLGAAGRKGQGISFEPGDIQELWADRSLRTGDEAFDASRMESGVIMRRALPDGSTIERVIQLGSREPSEILCKTTIYHRGTDTMNYEFKVRPEFDTWTDTTDTSILATFILGNEWKQFNQDWKASDGPRSDLLSRSKGGAYALFNHQEGFGVQINYHPEQVSSPKLWWKPEWEQANLELIFRPVELSKGVQYSYDYSIEFLEKAPN